MNALKLNHSSQPQLLNDDSMPFSKVEHVLQSVNKLKKIAQTQAKNFERCCIPFRELYQLTGLSQRDSYGKYYGRLPFVRPVPS